MVVSLCFCHWPNRVDWRLLVKERQRYNHATNGGWKVFFCPVKLVKTIWNVFVATWLYFFFAENLDVSKKIQACHKYFVLMSEFVDYTEASYIFSYCRNCTVRNYPGKMLYFLAFKINRYPLSEGRALMEILGETSPWWYWQSLLSSFPHCPTICGADYQKCC